MRTSEHVIRFRDVTKSFAIHRGHMLLREHIKVWLHRARASRFTALKGVSFDVYRGESMAVVGPNGAGKSTVLALIAGLAAPDSGTVDVSGRVAALLELGSGFHGDLTGAENVRLNASLLGLSREKTHAAFDDIVEFAGIGDFMQEPLRTYSSGMKMRLAFAVAVNVDPDILLIDEVLAVGDAAFQEKCYQKLREFRKRGKALVCVSHGNAMLSELCDRAIWLEHGEVVGSGSVAKILRDYAGFRPAVTAG